MTQRDFANSNGVGLSTLVKWLRVEREAVPAKVKFQEVRLPNPAARCENAIRPSALGKKNFLFIGHPEVGERSAVIYTLLGSCRRHGINPFDYLKNLFTRLPAARITQIREFAPAAWANAKAKEKLVAEAA